MVVATGFIALACLTLCSTGCTALPAAAGYFTSGGVTLYKNAKETGPKAEFVLVKFEINHTVTTMPAIVSANCSPNRKALIANP